MSKKEILVGSHISSAGEIHLAFARGESIGCTAMQIFTKSSRQWFAKKLKESAVEAFKDAAKKSSIKIVVSHAGYLINIASKNPEIIKKSVKSLIDEINLCESLQIPYLVLHPGSHIGGGEEHGMKLIAENLDIALDAVPGKTMILLENMAGQGTNLGYKFEQLRKIIDLCKNKKRLGVCFDTCHAFAAGYDISTPETYKETFKLFDKIIGIEKLKAIHVNNSAGALGSKIDRHTPLTDGKIPLEAFKLMMNDKNLIDIPKILETPSDSEMKLWEKEIKLLKSLVK
ncbi:MAG: deoxyribonuclease IV [bacterium]